MVLRIGKNVGGVPTVVVFDHCSFHELGHAVNGLWSEVGVVFEQALQRFEEGVVFVDGVVLDELFILLDDFADKGFDGFETALATADDIVQTFLEDLLNYLCKLILDCCFCPNCEFVLVGCVLFDFLPQGFSHCPALLYYFGKGGG